MLRRKLAILATTVAFGSCFEQAPDKIDLVALTSLNPATVALDGRRESCVDDELHHGSGVIEVDNVLSPSGCSAEIAVFADSHFMQFLTPVSFQDSGNDIVRVNMGSLLNVPLTVWILFQNPTRDRQREVEIEVNRATQLFDLERCGMEFSTVAVNVQTTGFPFELLDSGCERINDFKNVGFDRGRINVYYIRTVNDDQGERCQDGTSDVLLIGGSKKDSETLAHELGHATSLGDLNTTQGLGVDNLMLSPGTGRNSISLGQCFRSNVNVASVLNRSQIRNGPTRICPDAANSPTCPPLALQ